MASYETLGAMPLDSVMSQMGPGVSQSLTSSQVIRDLYAKLGERGFENMVAAINGTQTGVPMNQDTAIARIKGLIKYPNDARPLYLFLKSLSSTGYARDTLTTHAEAPKTQVQVSVAAPVAPIMEERTEISQQEILRRSQEAAEQERINALKRAELLNAQRSAPVMPPTKSKPVLTPVNAPYIQPKSIDPGFSIDAGFSMDRDYSRVPPPHKSDVLLPTPSDAPSVPDKGPSGQDAIISPSAPPATAPEVATESVEVVTEKAEVPWAAIALGAGVLFLAMR